SVSERLGGEFMGEGSRRSGNVRWVIEESLRPSITSTDNGLGSRTRGMLFRSANVASIKAEDAPLSIKQCSWVDWDWCHETEIRELNNVSHELSIHDDANRRGGSVGSFFFF
ncbi:hypothetical protein B5P40_32130, partial [Bacillus sp. SRB_8]